MSDLAKVCSKCGPPAKPLEDFYRAAKGRLGVEARCKRCKQEALRESVRRRYENDPEQILEKGRRYRKRHQAKYNKRAILRKYGLTEARYDDMLAAQGGVCAICGGGPVGRGGKLHVDHDHETGLVRGLLCQSCNTALGLFQERAPLMQAAIAYLERHA